MNGKSQAEQHERNSRKYLNQAADLHFINPSSGLYVPKLPTSESKIHKNRSGELEDRPLYVSTKTTWVDRVPVIVAVVGLFISALTLIFLIKTVDYARKQWIEAQRTANASICASKTASTPSLLLGRFSRHPKLPSFTPVPLFRQLVRRAICK